MKIALIARSTLYSVPGGDTIQIQETAKYMNALGICADIKLTNEIREYGDYDLLHFFNISRPADISYHIKKSKKKFVVSTNLVDYSNYDKYHRKGLPGLLFSFLSNDSIEYLKTMARCLFGKDKLISRSFIFKGQRKCITEILSKSKLLLPNSYLEYKAIAETYHVAPDFVSIPNGICRELFRNNNAERKNSFMVVCAARIEGIKNQLNLIKALNNTAFELFIIGKPASNQISYYKACRRIAASNIRFIDHLPQEELAKYYQKAKVHILPSWFETTGLSSLEAAAMGCSVVITDKGYAKEYFGDDAVYCDPSSPESILASVHLASKQPLNKTLQKKIITDYTWEQSSIKTIKAYKKILEN